ncbi:F-box domain [Macleaya cordata]|uniref:F-box domain n=1 Tax=Macleaya cordata TaxID=56857 RepID=A0A200QRP1_MACCD|nr:F-box domain [Macleaya cordata]
MDFPTPDSLREVRNWLDLPQEVMSLVFLKLEAVDILLGSQLVCSAWQKISKEPHLWHLVQIQSHQDSLKVVKIARAAVDRSCGKLVKLSMDSQATDELLQYIADR